MYGQQSLMPLIKAVTWGFGGGQSIEAALAVLVRAAARGQAAAVPAASAAATAASTTVPASLAGIPVPQGSRDNCSGRHPADMGLQHDRILPVRVSMSSL